MLRVVVVVKSAPENPCVTLAIYPRSTSLAKGDLRRLAFKIASRDLSSGRAPPASPTLPPRALAIESNSSKNRTQGAAERALSKISLTLASDSPNHIVSNSGPLTDIKFAWHSLAMALANNVLPQPGGYCTNSCNSFLTFSKPPMSAQVVLGTSTTVSRRAEGLDLVMA
uniref:Uncharacterized protein n=1 Tax=Glossina pallidipes TaxID=7398 RepID=A0A1A9ZDZ9_GLOPL